jgi:putative transposase
VVSGVDARYAVLCVPARGSTGALRQIMKTRGHFPNDEAATKLLWLALNITATWVRGVHTWKEAMNPFAILYDEGRRTKPMSITPHTQNT